MFTYEYKHLRVRYADTDQMGYVYYGNYARFYEIGRVEALRSLGMSYRDLEEEGTMMPVYDNYSRYLLPARYDDLLTIKVTISQLPTVRMVFEYEITNQDGVLLNTGQTTLIFLNRQTNRPTRIPATLLAKLKPHFE
ncbi:MAG: acyl-CoA thioesterase [Runella slithyformis]|nr:MAG: acyl-CoA thioesterase [Runella slithyformis]TAF25992.1 MAG: acyl-CoA thioesterase [Runella slithyformis]TAF45703.1 MAG: acyl-CoA thioesterase [Runella slithyformis]TAF81107.1 MAG: acyl-CoA thioesterase [Runella slithyformis]TAH06778.1 MAG: acyl-CoA thioesterase [Runella slithyformis]